LEVGFTSGSYVATLKLNGHTFRSHGNVILIEAKGHLDGSAGGTFNCSSGSSGLFRNLGLITPGTMLVRMTGGGGWELNLSGVSGIDSVYRLEIEQLNDYDAVTLSGRLEVNEDLDIKNGILDTASYQIAVHVDLDIEIASGKLGWLKCNGSGIGVFGSVNCNGKISGNTAFIEIGYTGASTTWYCATFVAGTSTVSCLGTVGINNNSQAFYNLVADDYGMGGHLVTLGVNFGSVSNQTHVLNGNMKTTQVVSPRSVSNDGTWTFPTRSGTIVLLGDVIIESGTTMESAVPPLTAVGPIIGGII
jgi:hypothetical protein